MTTADRTDADAAAGPAPTAPSGPPSDRPGGGRRRGRRLVRFAVAVVVVLLVAELGVRALAPRLGEPQTWYSLQVQQKLDRLDDEAPAARRTDVVFAGSSSVMSALDPHRFAELDACGRTAYNAGIVGATPTMTHHWLDEEVLPRTGPGTVVLGITPRDLSEGAAGVEPQYFSAAAVRDDAWARADRAAGEVSELVRYRSVLRDVAKLRARLFDLPEDGEAQRPIDGRGWSTRPTAAESPYAPREYQGARAATGPPRRAAVEDLRDLASDLRSRGIEVVLAEMPVVGTWSTLSPVAGRGARESHRALVRLAEAEDLELVDLRSVDDRSMFVDPVHTNAAGAEAATQALADRLGRTGC